MHDESHIHTTVWIDRGGISRGALSGGATAAILAECRDTEIGRKYAFDEDASASGVAQTWARGYLNTFQAGSYAKDAFDKWSLLVAQRVAELRGVKPPPKQARRAAETASLLGVYEQ